MSKSTNPNKITVKCKMGSVSASLSKLRKKVKQEHILEIMKRKQFFLTKAEDSKYKSKIRRQDIRRFNEQDEQN